VQLRNWADVFLVAPLSANTLAKLANGLCDNLLTCIARAWDFTSNKPFIVAPAMNTAMWTHPITAAQLSTLRSFGVAVIDPITKKLACGDVGMGAMATIESLVAAVVAATSIPFIADSDEVCSAETASKSSAVMQSLS
jgi:phosphopantothenoylcysteine decarboxylase